jgi:hypothetical protein
MSKHDTATTSDSHAQVESVDAPTRKHNQCRGCGREIDSELARVIGDNDGCVPRCKHCSQYQTSGNNNGLKLTASAAHRDREGI